MIKLAHCAARYNFARVFQKHFRLSVQLCATQKPLSNFPCVHSPAHGRRKRYTAMDIAADVRQQRARRAKRAPIEAERRKQRAPRRDRAEAQLQHGLLDQRRVHLFGCRPGRQSVALRAFDALSDHNRRRTINQNADSSASIDG